MSLIDKAIGSFNAFFSREPTTPPPVLYGETISYSRPDKIKMTRGNESTIITAPLNRIALDVAATTIKHVYVDDQDRYIGDIDSGLNDCLTVEANIDQTSRSFLQDLVLFLFDEGHVCCVPVETKIYKRTGRLKDVETIRNGKVVEWRPRHVKVDLYNDRFGKHQQIYCSKKDVAIIENPFYVVMNENNSVLKRLVRKLTLLDIIDEKSGSDKLNMIIQLPYAARSDALKQRAKDRTKELEYQLKNSQYGIAYIDGSEKVTQLNRSLENNLLAQVEFLTRMLYSQLGITEAILNGTANEQEMINYTTRTVEPIVSAIVDEFKRKFITKTGRTQGQDIIFFRDPFRLVTASQLADIADKYTRNEILTSNEVRAKIGMKPSDNPRADELQNKNMPIQDLQQPMEAPVYEEEPQEDVEYLE